MINVKEMATGRNDPRPPSVRIFLRGSDNEPLEGILGRVASSLGLDIYKSSLLGQRARIEMKSAALVLLVIFLFDFGAWTLLFNTLLHSEILAIDGWSVLAVLGGLLFAVAVLLYERQFFTADVWEGWRSVAKPMAARLLVIIAAALATAQPVELLFFKEAIAYRAHEEGIRLEVVSRRKELERINRELDELRAQIQALPTAVQKEIEYGEWKTANDQVSALRAQKEELEKDIANAEGNVAYWRSEAARRRQALAAERARDPLRVSAAGASVRRAEGAQQQWQERLSSFRSELRSVDSRLPTAETEATETWKRFEARRSQLEADHQAKVQKVKARGDRIERWVRQLRQAKPGDPQPIVEAEEEESRASGAPARPIPPPTSSQEPTEPKWEYRFPDYHFFRQLRVLKDLRVGNPPLWEGVSTGEAQRLAEQYGLEDVRPCPESTARRGTQATDPCDERHWQRHLQETAMYFWSWLVVYGVAFVIPMLVIAMKLLMPPELKAYYSATCQALAGNPDAIAFRQIAAEAECLDLNTSNLNGSNPPRLASGGLG